MYKPNVNLKEHSAFLLIPTGSDFNKVTSILKDKNLLFDDNTFEWVARLKHYNEKVKPGRYKLTHRMSNNDLVNLLRSGKQEPVRVTFVNVRSVAELAGKVSHLIEADSVSLYRLMTNRDTLVKYDVTPITAFVLFIPNTYEFFWNTTAGQFIERMYREKKKFWNEERVKHLHQTGLSISQVVILASIVEKETVKDDEKPAIAGVYINRFHKNWPLQADPTLIFAWNDYTIRRVLNKHKEIKSPYNTYLNTGLPPGPICLPSVSSIDAILTFKRHNFMFFCAKDDLSGYHLFAVTLQEHNRNARKYQSVINRLNIR